MTSRINRLLVVLLITTMTGVMAFAKGKKQTVTLMSNVNVNGTLVKKGTYDVAFDEKTSELSIIKSGKTIAKTSARIEKQDDKARNTKVQTKTSGSDEELVSVTFGGSDEAFVVTPTAAKN